MYSAICNHFFKKTLQKLDCLRILAVCSLKRINYIDFKIASYVNHES